MSLITGQEEGGQEEGSQDTWAKEPCKISCFHLVSWLSFSNDLKQGLGPYRQSILVAGLTGEELAQIVEPDKTRL